MAKSVDTSIPLPSAEPRPGEGSTAVESTATARPDPRGVPASILIGTIALLVLLVSLPRFRAHALAANREDARIALDVLGAVVFDPERTALDTGPGGLVDVIQSHPPLRHRFPDARRAKDNGQLVHHGYRIDTGTVMIGVLGWPALLAWPNEYEKGGDVAYALTSDGRMWGHLNGGLWTAGDRGLFVADLSDEGWVQIRPARGE